MMTMRRGAPTAGIRASGAGVLVLVLLDVLVEVDDVEVAELLLVDDEELVELVVVLDDDVELVVVDGRVVVVLVEVVLVVVLDVVMLDVVVLVLARVVLVLVLLVVVVVARIVVGGGGGASSPRAIVTPLPRSRTVDGVASRRSRTMRSVVGVNCPVRTRSRTPSAPSSRRGADRPSTAPSKSSTMRSGVAPSAASGWASGRPGGAENRSRTTGAVPPAMSICSRDGVAASTGTAPSSTSTPTHRMFRVYAMRMRLSSRANVTSLHSATLV
jgi:hypothetical protein